MPTDVGRAVAALDGMTVTQLVRTYAAVFGEPTRGRNRTWLVRKIAWRLQADAGGGLTDRARRRAAELAAGADLRATPPRVKAVAADDRPPPRVVAFAADPRVPVPGTVLTRRYKGADVRVAVRPDGFEHAGAVYPSLSAVAKAVTGSHLNGFAFFRLGGKGGAA